MANQDYSHIVPRTKTLTREPRDTSCRPRSWEDAALLITESGRVIWSVRDWDGGDGISVDEWHNRDLRFVIANAKGGAVKLDTAALRHDLKPGGKLALLIDRIIAGHTVEWDGDNMVGRLTDDAREASEALEDALHGPARWRDTYRLAA
jgi:hypothetical protein